VPGAIAGGFAGPALFEFVQQLGPIALERAKNNGRDKPNAEDWTYATGTSVGVGAMNAIAPGASGTAKRMLIEGATEGGQSVVEQVGSTALTKKGLEVDPRQAVAEGIIGGTSAGMVDTSVSTAKAAANLVRGTNRNSKAKLEDVSEEEMQAKASFAQTLAAIAEEENLDLTNIDRTSTKGARQAIDLAHKRLVGDLKARIKDLKPRLAVTDQDTLSELEDKIFANLAQDEARTKVKNKVGSREKEAFIKLAGDTYEGQLSLNLMLQLDELTAIHSEGYKGGVSRVTDQLAPLGLGGEGYDVSRANAEQVFRPVLSVAAASQTGGLSLIPQAAIWGGGRLIDKARGGRSRVKAYVDKNQNNPGQTLPDESTSLRNQNIETQQAEAAEAEAARLRQEQLAQESREADLDLARENAPPNPESPQGIFELGTALDRSGIAQVLRVIKRTADSEVSRWIQAYETSVATGGQVDYRLVRKINGFVDKNPVYKGLMGNRVRNQGVVQGAVQQQLSQKEQNYERGRKDNLAEAARITEAINADGTIKNVIHKALLLNTLEKMQMNLGKNPVATLQKMAIRLEEKGVPSETVEKYLGQYLQRVMAQQGAKEELAVAKDAALEAVITDQNPLNIEPDDNLKPEFKVIEQRFSEQLNGDIDKAIRDYAALPGSDGGRIINTDLARELSPDYRADRALSSAVHEPASAFTREMYARALQKSAPKGKNNEVLFTAGGTGAGKSTALNDVLALQQESAQAIYDTNLASLEGSIKKIDQALAAGKQVTVAYVYRGPIKALIGAIKRAIRMGRTVPIDIHVGTHVRSAQTVKELDRHYAANTKVEFALIDNNGGQGDARNLGEDLSTLPDYDYNQLLEEAINVLTESRAQGLPQEIYDGFNANNTIS
jgi:hypothetical protein